MPLTLAKTGQQNIIKKVGGPPDTRQFLEKLGFVPGSIVTIIAETGGNVIVSIKESRIAISREMASKILV
jgi:ferrous iron transport protein A